MQAFEHALSMGRIFHETTLRDFQTQQVRRHGVATQQVVDELRQVRFMRSRAEMFAGGFFPMGPRIEGQTYDACAPPAQIFSWALVPFLPCRRTTMKWIASIGVGLRELSRRHRQSYTLRIDVVRVASFYVHKSAGIEPLPSDPPPR